MQPTINLSNGKFNNILISFTKNYFSPQTMHCIKISFLNCFPIKTNKDVLHHVPEHNINKCVLPIINILISVLIDNPLIFSVNL